MRPVMRCWIAQTLAGPVLVTEDQVEDYRQQHFRVDGPYILATEITAEMIERGAEGLAAERISNGWHDDAEACLRAALAGVATNQEAVALLRRLHQSAQATRGPQLNAKTAADFWTAIDEAGEYLAALGGQSSETVPDGQETGRDNA